jgi:hypothetical protein
LFSGFRCDSISVRIYDLDHSFTEIKDFGRLFANVAGKPKDVYEMRSLISKRRFYLKRLKPEHFRKWSASGVAFRYHCGKARMRSAKWSLATRTSRDDLQ